MQPGASPPSPSPRRRTSCGLPSLHAGHWDPFMAACAETSTVICLRIGSSSDTPSTADARSTPSASCSSPTPCSPWSAGSTRPDRPRRPLPRHLRDVGGHRADAGRDLPAQLPAPRSRGPSQPPAPRPHRRRLPSLRLELAPLAGALPAPAARRHRLGAAGIAWENAAELFNHSVPEAIAVVPDAFDVLKVRSAGEPSARSPPSTYRP